MHVPGGGERVVVVLPVEITVQEVCRQRLQVQVLPLVDEEGIGEEVRGERGTGPVQGLAPGGAPAAAGVPSLTAGGSG